jgi:DNA-binding transcriptional regulator/RsmH inhibitor MraZ
VQHTRPSASEKVRDQLFDGGHVRDLSLDSAGRLAIPRRLEHFLDAPAQLVFWGTGPRLDTSVLCPTVNSTRAGSRATAPRAQR